MGRCIIRLHTIILGLVLLTVLLFVAIRLLGQLILLVYFRCLLAVLICLWLFIRFRVNLLSACRLLSLIIVLLLQLMDFILGCLLGDIPGIFCVIVVDRFRLILTSRLVLLPQILFFIRRVLRFPCWISLTRIM